jgi:transcriptional regulator with XRE-family HTH domain
MAKRRMLSTITTESFGERLARLRAKAGYTQRELAAELGISHRMVAYYEAQTTYPPTHLLPQLAALLAVSTDGLLGVEDLKPRHGVRDNRLWRRFQKIEKLSTREKRQIIQILDSFIEREQLRQKTA